MGQHVHETYKGYHIVASAACEPASGARAGGTGRYKPVAAVSRQREGYIDEQLIQDSLYSDFDDHDQALRAALALGKIYIDQMTSDV